MNAPVPHEPAVRTTCPYCGVGCGLIAQPDGRGGAAIVGDPTHPANFGRTCSKGSALGETLGLAGRLLHPMLRQGDGTLTQVAWSEAIDKVAEGLSRVIDRDGPDAVAFYLSGQLLTEDYYVANKLMKGFLGSANVDTNSRLCMASSVAGHRRAFGSDTVPGTYADLDEADLIVLVGSNAAWCHPVLFQRMMRNKAERGARVVVIDPRRTVTAEEADLFLPIAPGTDTALFCGLLVDLAERGAIDTAYVDANTTGFAAALARAREIAPDKAATARATGLDEDAVAHFFDLFYATARVVTCFSQGVNQSAQGTDKVNAIINCHLATGRIGRPGMGPFSLTGQPNAMGGREVGGLANQLAAHMGFTAAEIDRVRRFWNAPRMATREGRKAVAMFEAIERGEIKALWVMATNPAVSLPRAGAVRAALDKLELFVVSENVRSNDTVNAGAHVLLPAAAWGEKDGAVTNSERRISRQRAFLPLPGEARPDWWIVSQVARRMGFAEAFDYRTAADVFREHAALSAFENDGARDFDLGALAQISEEAYDTLAPVQWPLRAGEPARETRFFADGGFFTEDRKARFIAPEPPALRDATSAAFPFRLNTGRIRDQWHTMTRTGASARLAAHLPEPFVEVHPQDADAAGLTDGGLAQVATPHGACVLKVVVSDGQQRGSSVRADPLERRDRLLRARRRPGRSAHRSLFRPARGQGDAGRRCAGRVAAARLHPHPPRHRAAGGNLVGAGRGQRRDRVPARDRARPDGLARFCPSGACRRRQAGGSARRPRLSCRRLRRRRARRLPVRRPGRRAADLGRGGPSRRGRSGRRATDRTHLERSDRRDRAGDLRVLRGRGRHRPPSGRRGHREKCCRHRPHAARRHQLRIVPARAQTTHQP